MANPVTTSFVTQYLPGHAIRLSQTRDSNPLINILLGEYYVGPWDSLQDHPLQHATACAYTWKGMTGVWKYFPGEEVVSHDNLAVQTGK